VLKNLSKKETIFVRVSLNIRDRSLRCLDLSLLSGIDPEKGEGGRGQRNMLTGGLSFRGRGGGRKGGGGRLRVSNRRLSKVGASGDPLFYDTNKKT
jgi:hypothetical protein